MSKLLPLLFFVFLFQPAFSAYYTTSPAVQDIDMTNSIREFNHLSLKEKKERIAAVKKEIKNYKENGYADDQTILYAIVAILLPPLAVYLHQGEINTKFWISLILSLIFWIPGVVYALLVIFDQV